VGEAQTQIVTSKDLLLRPAIQRFFVRGDHVRLSTVVQNNLATDLSAEVSIQVEGIVLDDPNQATQQIAITANGRALVEWWGIVQNVDTISLTFWTQAGEYQDAVVVQNGSIPVLAFISRIHTYRWRCGSSCRPTGAGEPAAKHFGTRREWGTETGIIDLPGRHNQRCAGRVGILSL
jgi:hypothetical protein